MAMYYIIKKYISFLFAVTFMLYGNAQVLVNDNFTNSTTFIDNTTKALWGSNTVPSSAFELVSKTAGSLSYNSIHLTAAAFNNGGYVNSTELRTATSIDYELGETIDRNNFDLKIEFDAVWSILDGSGESGRLVVTAMSDYPAGGPAFNAINNLSATDPFGKPLYNVRLRNKTGSSNTSLLLYGAGTSTNPEWEKYSSGSNNWWLPGFSVQSGGGSPGSGPDYPGSGTKIAQSAMVSTTIWKHYTMLIKKERVEVYHRNSNQPATSDVLAFFIQTPSTTNAANQLAEINAAHNTTATTLPPFYAWHNNINAVRFYWRASRTAGTDADTWLANVVISKVANNSLLNTYNLQLNTQPLHNSNFIKAQWLEPNVQAITLQKSVDGTIFTTVQHKVLGANEQSFNYYDNQVFPVSYYKIILQKSNGSNVQSSISKVLNKNNKENTIRITTTPYGIVLYRSVLALSTQQLVIFNTTGQVIAQYTLGASPIEYINFKPLTKQILYYKIVDKKSIVDSGKMIW